MQTECPNCHTLFRITETQLKMAHGRVRCGFCKEVFDARPADSLRDNRDKKDAEKDTPETRTPAVDDVSDAESPAARESIPVMDDEFIAGSHARNYSTAATAAWSVAILALIALLAAEYVWFNQPELLHGPGVKPIAAKLCQFTDCDHLQRRDPSQIEMISRNVYSHPNEKDALMVSTTLANQAPFAQPYPDVQIDFSNVRGELIASRRFRPEEYLKHQTSDTGLLQSGTTIAFALEIRDPGREAITYEFSFH